MAKPAQTLTLSSWFPPTGPTHPEEIGGKAAGLLTLPSAWTPPFVVLGRDFWKAWNAVDRSAKGTFAAAGQGEPPPLAELVSRCRATSRAAGLIVRSNAPSESGSEARGRYISLDVPLDIEETLRGVDRVLSQGTDSEPVFAVVQIRMRRQALGHLSNERRVAERRSQWLIEETQADGESTKAKKRISIGPGEPLSMDVGDRNELYEALRAIAFDLYGQTPERLHCEWVWDGEHLWILQRDVIRTPPPGAGTHYLEQKPEATGGAGSSPSLRCICSLSKEEAGAWSKLGRRYVMEDAGLPVAPVYLLPGSSFAIDRDRDFADLRHDLRVLAGKEEPLVLRTDLVERRREASLSLPTSPPLVSVEALLEWMTKTAEEFGRQGIPDSDWAFLPASLVPARASVMVQARPRSQLIRLDALWGFPDGVACLPHDSYSLLSNTPDIRRRKSHKGTCLLWHPERGWVFEAIFAPYDWLEVLSDEEILCAASWARRLANQLGEEIQLMVLARIGGGRGEQAMLAWHYTDHKVPVHRKTLPTLPAGTLAEVSGPDDLEAIQPELNVGIVFRPAVEWRRDPDFVNAVAARAANLRLPIFFEGSTLGHTFYLLSSAGANVVSIGSQIPELPPSDYNKLVRDRIPNIVTESGGRARIVRAGQSQAGWLLRQKLVEEAFEVWNSSDDEIVGELADLIEVLNALYQHLSLDPAAVEAVREEKREKRGGFEELVFLEYTRPDDHLRTMHEPGDASLLDPIAEADLTEPDSPRAGDRVTVSEDQSSITFRVTVVPPLLQGVPLRVYSTRVNETQVRFRHDGPFLEVTVERKASSAADQLALPLDPDPEHHERE